MNQREMWLESMIKIANPVLEALSKGKLKENFPFDFHSERKVFAPLEAFGRTVCGMAPWLELEGLSGKEKELQEYYRIMVLQALDAATDPKSPDYMSFGNEGDQALVDTAFLAHALLRAPKQIVGCLNERVKTNVIQAFKTSRQIIHNDNNWLLFSAMVETALHLLGADYDRMRIDYPILMFEEWYKGDGIYGDGKELHCDYYNSFVIQPMLVDIIKFLESEVEEYQNKEVKVMKRASRYASILERMIGTDGTYPIIGRSITYRFGAFQLLSQAALEHFLEDSVKPAQVREALSAVIKKVMLAPKMFDEKGWLLPGVYGYQPDLAEEYINIGSLYLCCTVFLPLGLSPEDEFWSAKDEKWTSKKVWDGEYVSIDHAI